ncbi:MAG: hypothetical protein AB8B50_18560 [Pirellulaceae bacterium]
MPLPLKHTSRQNPADSDSACSFARKSRDLWALKAWPVACLIWLAIAVSCGVANAGLTASEVVVVVNGQSFNSRTLANHYVALRDIPAQNVIVLPEVPNSEVVAVDAFRQRILAPLLEEIDARNLSHVQCIAYSCDFPTAIDISQDMKQLGKVDKVFTRKASINALTYLFQSTMRAVPNYITLMTNSYARTKIDDYFRNPLGELTAEKWQTASDLMNEAKHAEASETLEELFKEYPHQFPMAYLAAAEAALAGQKERSIELLNLAIEAGWSAGGYLAKDSRFDSLRDEADFQVLDYLLDPSQVYLLPTASFSVSREGKDPRDPKRTTTKRLSFWSPNGIRLNQADFGRRYLLSTVLGVTRGSGTTLTEALEYLKLSSQVDSTHPTGTFYFSLTKDVRTTTRRDGFISAIDALKEMGFGAEFIKSKLPQGKTDILGLQIGTPSFNWASSKSKFVPGAIADNLTSFGGVMTSSSQTKLSEFMRNGAVGSSGTVTEPYAIQAKFPLPMLYVHYARGASLAEAFYQSVSGPYQLLIVGDPLCQPFSNAPRIEASSELLTTKEDGRISLPLSLDGPDYEAWITDSRPESERIEALRPTHVALLLNGGLSRTQTARSNIAIALKDMPRGHHELRLQLVNRNDPLEQKSESLVPVWIGPRDLLEISIPDGEVKRNAGDGRLFSVASLRDKTIKVQVECAEEAEEIRLMHASEELGLIQGGSGTIEIDLSKTGRGPLRIYAEAKLPNEETVRSQPLWLRVDP